MITILSPAKTLDFDSTIPPVESSEPAFQKESLQLIKKLRSLSKKKVKTLMNLSSDLTELNVQRYNEWEPDFQPDFSRPAIFAFNGEVYRGFNAGEMDEVQLNFAQHHLRILSGLHGLLRPLDRIRPYRLEMGTSLAVRRKKNLYSFWGDKITQAINEALDETHSDTLINLASNEYSKAIDFSKVNGRVITPVFKDLKNGEYKVIMTWAKQARGSLAAFIVKNGLTDAEDLKRFDEYEYLDHLSNADEWVFVRGSK